MLIRQEDGFSLLEVIFAVAVLGIIMLPVYSMFTAGSFASLTGRHQTIATTLAQDEMEALKGKGYEKLRELMAGREELNLEEDLGEYKKKVRLNILQLEEIASSGEGEIILIHIAVYRGKSNENLLVSLTSFLGKGLKTDEKEFF